MHQDHGDDIQKLQHEISIWHNEVNGIHDSDKHQWEQLVELLTGVSHMSDAVKVAVWAKNPQPEAHKQFASAIGSLNQKMVEDHAFYLKSNKDAKAVKTYAVAVKKRLDDFMKKWSIREARHLPLHVQKAYVVVVNYAK